MNILSLPLLEQYEFICDRILKEFIYIYFVDGYDEIVVDDYYDGYLNNWVWRDAGGVARLGDYFVNMNEMLTCLRHDITPKAFFDWYDACIATDNECPNLYGFWITYEEQYIS